MFAGLLNKLYKMTWYAFIGASLRDPRLSVRYIGRYTKRAVLAEYRITYYEGKMVRFSFKDYAQGGKTSYKTMPVLAFIGRLIRHIPDCSFPMVRHYGLFSNRWKSTYLPQAREALGLSGQSEPTELYPSQLPWALRQEEYTGENLLYCQKCDIPMVLVDIVFGRWEKVEFWFRECGLRITPGYLRLKPDT